MILGVVIVALCIVVAALLRAGATSLLRVPRADAIRDAADGRSGAGRAVVLLEDRDKLVPAVNVSHLFLVSVAAVVTGWLVPDLVADIPAVLTLATGAGLIFVLADLVPRAVGRRRSLLLGYRLIRLISAAVAAGAFTTDFVIDEDDEIPDETPEEEEQERRLIGAALEFGDTVVREVMVPRIDVISVPQDMTVRSAVGVFGDNGFSRLPVVVGDDHEEVVGLVILKDLLAAVVSGLMDGPIEPFVRPVQFVPETLHVADLLRIMQTSKSHLAMVVDEFGGTCGLVTIEDLLEELVGEIVDEYDDEKLLVEERENGALLVDGRLSVGELSEIIGAELPDDEWDTVAGLVLDLAGRVPEEMERFESGPVALTVARVQGRRIGSVLVERIESESEHPS